MERENHEKEQCINHAGTRPCHPAGVPCHPTTAGTGAKYFLGRLSVQFLRGVFPGRVLSENIPAHG